MIQLHYADFLISLHFDAFAFFSPDTADYFFHADYC